MPLLAQPPRVELTTADKQNRAANRLRQTALSTFQQLVSVQQASAAIVWSNPQGLGAQEVCDGLGTDAGKLFAFHAVLTEAIVKLAQADGIEMPQLAKPIFAFAVNGDGTVRVDPNTPYAG